MVHLMRIIFVLSVSIASGNLLSYFQDETSALENELENELNPQFNGMYEEVSGNKAKACEVICGNPLFA